jgi:hypothetical protein
MNVQINTHSWTLIEEGVRDCTWAKIKNGKVHVLTWYHDEDGYFSRNVFIGDTYEEAVKSEEVLSHWETFTPDYDKDY